MVATTSHMGKLLHFMTKVDREKLAKARQLRREIDAERRAEKQEKKDADSDNSN